MKDYIGNLISIGDTISIGVPEEQIDGYVTIDKHYIVKGLREEEDRVVIIDDTGREGWYKSNRFVSHQHFSELP